MAKKITGYINLQVPAGQANPSPPIGPALGQRGLNIMEFCKAFNAATQGMEPGSPVPVLITVYQRQVLHLRDEDRRRRRIFCARRRPRSTRAPRSRGAGASVGRVTMAQCREIAERKMQGLNARDLDAARRDDRGIGPLHGHRSGGVSR